MCKQHFTKALIQLFIVLKNCQRDIFERQSLQTRAGFSRTDQRNQRSAQRCHLVSKLLCPGIAVTGRAGQRIRFAAGCHNHAVRAVQLALGLDTDNTGFIGLDAGHTLLYNRHAAALDPEKQRVYNIPRLVRLRKHAVAALCFERYAQFLKELHGVLYGKRTQCTVQKARILRHMRQKFLHVTVVGDVAAPLACNCQLASHFFIALKQQHAGALLCCCSGSHQTGCAGSNHCDCYRIIHCRVSHIPHIRPKWIPDD